MSITFSLDNMYTQVFGPDRCIPNQDIAEISIDLEIPEMWKNTCEKMWEFVKFCCDNNIRSKDLLEILKSVKGVIKKCQFSLYTSDDNFAKVVNILATFEDQYLQKKLAEIDESLRVQYKLHLHSYNAYAEKLKTILYFVYMNMGSCIKTTTNQLFTIYGIKNTSINKLYKTRDNLFVVSFVWSCTTASVTNFLQMYLYDYKHVLEYFHYDTNCISLSYIDRGDNIHRENISAILPMVWINKNFVFSFVVEYDKDVDNFQNNNIIFQHIGVCTSIRDIIYILIKRDKSKSVRVYDGKDDFERSHLDFYNHIWDVNKKVICMYWKMFSRDIQQYAKNITSDGDYDVDCTYVDRNDSIADSHIGKFLPDHIFEVYLRFIEYKYLYSLLKNLNKCDNFEIDSSIYGEDWNNTIMYKVHFTIPLDCFPRTLIKYHAILSSHGVDRDVYVKEYTYVFLMFLRTFCKINVTSTMYLSNDEHTDKLFYDRIGIRGAHSICSLSCMGIKYINIFVYTADQSVAKKISKMFSDKFVSGIYDVCSARGRIIRDIEVCKNMLSEFEKCQSVLNGGF